MLSSTQSCTFFCMHHTMLAALLFTKQVWDSTKQVCCVRPILVVRAELPGSPIYLRWKAMDAPLADLLHPLPVAALGVFLRGVLDETEDAYEATVVDLARSGFVGFSVSDIRAVAFKVRATHPRWLVQPVAPCQAPAPACALCGGQMHGAWIARGLSYSDVRGWAATISFPSILVLRLQPFPCWWLGLGCGAAKRCASWTLWSVSGCPFPFSGAKSRVRRGYGHCTVQLLDSNACPRSSFFPWFLCSARAFSCLPTRWAPAQQAASWMDAVPSHWFSAGHTLGASADYRF